MGLMYVAPLVDTRTPADGDFQSSFNYIFFYIFQTPYDVVLLGGLSGRLDQTVHTLSFLHKLRKSGRRIFAVTDENVGWVLDEARFFFVLPHSRA